MFLYFKYIIHVKTDCRNIRIIDHDVDLKSLEPKNLSDDDLDNEPVVAVVVDERPKEVQELERFRKDNRWKVLG